MSGVAGIGPEAGKVNGLEPPKNRPLTRKMTPPPRKRGDPFLILGLATYIAAFLTPSFFSVDRMVAAPLAVAGAVLILYGLRRVWVRKNPSG